MSGTTRFLFLPIHQNMIFGQVTFLHTIYEDHISILYISSSLFFSRSDLACPAFCCLSVFLFYISIGSPCWSGLQCGCYLVQPAPMPEQRNTKVHHQILEQQKNNADESRVIMMRVGHSVDRRPAGPTACCPRFIWFQIANAGRPKCHAIAM